MTALEDAVFRVSKALECGICKDVLKQPQRTRCNHVYCKFCILKHLELSKSKCRCPLCKADLTKRGLSDCPTLETVIDKMRAAIVAIRHDADGVLSPSLFMRSPQTVKRLLTPEQRGKRTSRRQLLAAAHHDHDDQHDSSTTGVPAIADSGTRPKKAKMVASTANVNDNATAPHAPASPSTSTRTRTRTRTRIAVYDETEDTPQSPRPQQERGDGSAATTPQRRANVLALDLDSGPSMFDGDSDSDDGAATPLHDAPGAETHVYRNAHAADEQEDDTVLTQSPPRAFTSRGPTLDSCTQSPPPSQQQQQQQGNSSQHTQANGQTPATGTSATTTEAAEAAEAEAAARAKGGSDNDDGDELQVLSPLMPSCEPADSSELPRALLLSQRSNGKMTTTSSTAAAATGVAVSGGDGGADQGGGGISEHTSNVNVNVDVRVKRVAGATNKPDEICTQHQTSHHDNTTPPTGRVSLRRLPSEEAYAAQTLVVEDDEDVVDDDDDGVDGVDGDVGSGANGAMVIGHGDALSHEQEKTTRADEDVTAELNGNSNAPTPVHSQHSEAGDVQVVQQQQQQQQRGPLGDGSKATTASTSTATTASAASTVSSIKETSLAPPSRPLRACVLLLTGVPRDVEQRARAIADAMGATVLSKFDESVTHVLAALDENHLLISNTLKVMMGIASGKWIVSPAWLYACDTENRRANEEAFEMQGLASSPSESAPPVPPSSGARSSRLSSSPLLTGFTIAFAGQFESPEIQSEFRRVASLAGCTVVPLSAAVAACTTAPDTTVILVDSERVEDEVLDSLVDVPTDVVRDFYWLVDSVTAHHVHSPANYVLDTEEDTAPNL
ncbi:hypothetical protein PTSG_00772 [Salpingoeca rosetta]|uniref:RING-type E3 ubiquitin transferase BRCA1 n=1 Tax=Salpingoeca rosetta (strain ATCC 50818 / BSB-021) TaxID=946362 RepID=F2TXF4_SALR5|nr:uncharacterized protein PTSG_00772 [Salpingoeca rosetta]EGD76063.1 hypothetical protein PTSG_00772 [Salpingoeca rosetta]|eukprot:XP_004998238.1 hypothetical protein PTSG_00772 [Salpingoeca rosetta]